jgi:hypothetical protein
MKEWQQWIHRKQNIRTKVHGFRLHLTPPLLSLQELSACMIFVQYNKVTKILYAKLHSIFPLFKVPLFHSAIRAIKLYCYSKADGFLNEL